MKHQFKATYDFDVKWSWLKQLRKFCRCPRLVISRLILFEALHFIKEFAFLFSATRTTLAHPRASKNPQRWGGPVTDNINYSNKGCTKKNQVFHRAKPIYICLRRRPFVPFLFISAFALFPPILLFNPPTYSLFVLYPPLGSWSIRIGVSLCRRSFCSPRNLSFLIAQIYLG